MSIYLYNSEIFKAQESPLVLSQSPSLSHLPGAGLTLPSFLCPFLDTAWPTPMEWDVLASWSSIPGNGCAKSSNHRSILSAGSNSSCTKSTILRRLCVCVYEHFPAYISISKWDKPCSLYGQTGQSPISFIRQLFSNVNICTCTCTCVLMNRKSESHSGAFCK